MIHARIHSPQFLKWQQRFARVPRWAWIAFFIGAVIPVIVTVVLLAVTAIVTGAVVMAAVLVVGAVLGLVWRLLHRRPADDGRRNVQIVVRNVRVIDP